jgi:hypothetical protein
MAIVDVQRRDLHATSLSNVGMLEGAKPAKAVRRA